MIETMSRSISYARSGDVNIAYQVTGDGPIDGPRRVYSAG
jgi:hypothetical protein